MGYTVLDTGNSRSFPQPHGLIEQASGGYDALLILGSDVAAVFRELPDKDRYGLILLELGTECLGVHTAESRADEGSQVLGFARYRMGSSAPSDLVEVVYQPSSVPGAITLARQLFEAVGLKTALCRDFPGRIVDRLVRPYYNAALGRLDAGLATADDMDLTLRLGLGYPAGPIELLERTGLAEHYQVSEALHKALGDPAHAPARRAQVAWMRRQNS